jgi:hypothetical protein
MVRPTTDRTPTIAGIWRGRTTSARADEYERYVREHGITPLEEEALGVELLREECGRPLSGR